jgi:hypothetical protein
MDRPADAGLPRASLLACDRNFLARSNKTESAYPGYQTDSVPDDVTLAGVRHCGGFGQLVAALDDGVLPPCVKGRTPMDRLVIIVILFVLGVVLPLLTLFLVFLK